MFNKKILVVLIVLGSMFNMAKADAGVWTTFTEVYEVYTYSSGYLFMTFQNPDATHLNPDGCSAKRPYRVEASQVNRDDIYKMLLTAKASGKKVSAYIAGCGGSYPKVLHMRLHD